MLLGILCGLKQPKNVEWAQNCLLCSKVALCIAGPSDTEMRLPSCKTLLPSWCEKAVSVIFVRFAIFKHSQRDKCDQCMALLAQLTCRLVPQPNIAVRSFWLLFCDCSTNRSIKQHASDDVKASQPLGHWRLMKQSVCSAVFLCNATGLFKHIP